MRREQVPPSLNEEADEKMTSHLDVMICCQILFRCQPLKAVESKLASKDFLGVPMPLEKQAQRRISLLPVGISMGTCCYHKSVQFFAP